MPVLVAESKKEPSEMSEVNYTVKTWAEDTATQGCDRSADPAAGMEGAARVNTFETPGNIIY
jgi:hypothetical protein